jgi:hypothetical protein
MTQNTKLKQMPTKSGEWLEAECLKLARRTLGGSEDPVRHNQTIAPEGHETQLEGRRSHSAADTPGQ